MVKNLKTNIIKRFASKEFTYDTCINSLVSLSTYTVFILIMSLNYKEYNKFKINNLS